VVVRTQYRNEIIVLAAALLLVPALPLISSSNRGLPIGVLLLGAVSGAALAMQSIGVVLVYRSNRFVNFGQVYIGSVAAVTFSLLHAYRPIFRWIGGVCPPCVENPGRGLVLLNYWVSLVIGILLAVGFSYAIYTFVVKRLEGSPRLVVTVASIFLGPAALALVAGNGSGGLIVNFLTTKDQREGGISIGKAPLPFDFTWSVGPVDLHAPDVLTLLFAGLAVGGLYAFFRFSPMGTTIRASAENAGRAETLGVNVNAVNTRVWIMVGLLSGIPAMLATMAIGGGTGGISDEVDVRLAVRILLVAVVARFASLPMAAAAALVVGVVQQATFWVFGSSTPLVDGSIVIVVAGLLLLQSRQTASRAEVEQAAGWRSSKEIRPIPRELRELATVRKWVRTGGALAVVVLLGLPWAMSPGQTNLAAVVMIYAMLGLSLLILTGWAGQVSLGQFAFAAIGGYVTAAWDVPFVLAVAGGTVAGGVVAGLIGIPALRLRGFYLAISTLAFAVSVSAVLLNPRYLGKHLPDVLDRPKALGLDLDDQRVFYYFCLVVLVVVVLAVQRLRKSRTGRVLIAARDNEQATQSFGVSIVRARLTAFVLSGALAAFAGSLYAYHQHGVKVAAFGETQSFNIFTMTIIGGLGSVSGPILGALYTGLMLIFGASDVVRLFLIGFGGLAVVLLVPGGISQIVFGTRDALLRRVAKRNRLIVPSLVADSKGDRADGRPAIAPKLRAGGGLAFVPQRYALDHHWALPDAALVTSGPAPEFSGLAEGSDDG
jgi:branched-chain amino acid transport system permease protein